MEYVPLVVAVPLVFVSTKPRHVTTFREEIATDQVRRFLTLLLYRDIRLGVIACPSLVRSNTLDQVLPSTIGPVAKHGHI
jgi:hypothetical protein